MEYIELLGGVLFLSVPLGIAVIITAIYERRERKRERETEKRAIERIKERERRKAA